MGGRGGAGDQKRQSAERGVEREPEDSRFYNGSASSSGCCDCGAVCFRALPCSFFLLSSLTICSMERTFSGRLFLKCLRYSSSISSGRGNFQGSCFVLARLPNFLGFNPSSLAIWMWAWERWKFFRASIQRWYFSGVFLFAMDHIRERQVRLASLMRSYRESGSVSR
jgi:hypothetical protein